MDNKDLWEQFLKGSGETSDNGGKTPADRSLDPGYRAEDKPTTLDPSKEREFDIDAILADIHKQAAVREYTGTDTLSAGTTASKPARPVTNRAVTPPNSTPHAPSSNVPPGTVHGSDRQVMQEMMAMIRELTEEVKQLRAQIEAKPSEFVLDSYVGADPEAKPDICGEVEIPEEKPKKKKKTNKAVSIISNILFYTVIVSIVLGAFLLRSTSKGRPFVFAGYSMANVLTSSMEDVYPKGTLVITKSVDAGELKVGDDITFMVNENTTFTHRIIGITENYQNTGERAFETKGTMNKNSDKEMVAAANVVGKVVFHSTVLGNIANYIRTNWIFMVFVLVVIMALIFVLKRIFRDESPPKKAEKPDKINVNTRIK